MFCCRRRNQSEDHSHTHTEGLVGSRYPFTFLSINVGSSSRIKDTPSEGPVISSSGGKRSFNFSTSRSHDEEDAGLGQGADYSEPAKIRRRLSWSYGINRIFIDQNSSFCSNSYSSSNSIQVGEGLPKKDQFCMQERWIIMNESQEERTECLTSDGHNNETTSLPHQKHVSTSTTTVNRLSIAHDVRNESPEVDVPDSYGHARVSDSNEDLDDATFSHGEPHDVADNDHRQGLQESAGCDEEEERKESSSSFLFIGPVGKIRRHCRERRTSGDTEVEVLSPTSIPATPENPLSTPEPDPADPPPLVDDTTSEDSSRSRTSGSNNSREEGREEESTCSGLITSTPTSVIRSVPRVKRGDEQPLNLSLPDHALQSHSNQTHNASRVHHKQQRLRGEEITRERVSVINIAPRERLLQMEIQLQVDVDETGGHGLSPFPPQIPSGRFGESPSHYGHHGDLPQLGFEQQRHDTNCGIGNDNLSPDPSSTNSTDFFAISSGSVLSSTAAHSPNREPSSFQGLLLAQGIIPPQCDDGSGCSTLKKKLKCRDCGKEFSQLRNYKYHRSRHEGTQQFACTCPVCGKTFNDKGYLSSHLKIHRNEKEYKCEWCGKSFNQRVAYNMHIRIHTGHKPHQCDYCPKAFSRKMLLRQHIRTHTGERPYKCLICSKAFADRSNMLLHQRLHTGERPYKCHICGKSFSKNHHLKTHLNHHAGIKPYQCEKCKACFSQSSNMKTHYRKCTRAVNATATVTTNSLEPQPHSLSNSDVIAGPSSSSSRRSSSSLGMSQNLSPYGMEDVSILEEQQPHHLYQIQQQRLRQLPQPDEFIGLSPHQQQQLIQKISAFGHSQSVQASPLHSPNSISNRPIPATGYRSGSGSSSNSSLPMSLLIPQNISPYSVEEVQEAVLLEEQLVQHQHQIHQQRLRQLQPEQFIGLSPHEQQQLLQDMSASLGLSHRIPASPLQLHSPNRSSSSQSYLQSSSQALGINLGSMSLTSPTGSSSSRTSSRRTSAGIPLLPLGNSGSSSLSPTSLAAGHPFIPLNALDSVHGTIPPQLSPSSMASPHASLMLLSPRHHIHAHPMPIGDFSQEDFSRLQPITGQQHRNIISNRGRISSSHHQQSHISDTVQNEGSNIRGGHHPPQ